MRAIAQRDDSAQLHVYGGGEQGGSDQDEQDLHNVGTLGPVGRLMCRYCAADVSDPFNFYLWSVMMLSLQKEMLRSECTETSHKHGDHDPSARLHKLIQVHYCREGEQDGEQDRCGQGWVIAVVLEPLCVGAVGHGDNWAFFEQRMAFDL